MAKMTPKQDAKAEKVKRKLLRGTLTEKMEREKESMSQPRGAFDAIVKRRNMQQMLEDESRGKRSAPARGRGR